MKEVHQTEDPLSMLDETARQLVIGARTERDQALASKAKLESSLRLAQRGLDIERNQKIGANIKVGRLERELKALQERVSAISGLPDSERAQQIDQHLERLRIAAQRLAEATIEYRTAFYHLTEMFSGLGMGDANPDNHDHAFDYRWRYDDEQPDLPEAEPRRGGSLKDAVGRATATTEASNHFDIPQSPTYNINITTTAPASESIAKDFEMMRRATEG